MHLEVSQWTEKSGSFHFHIHFHFHFVNSERESLDTFSHKILVQFSTLADIQVTKKNGQSDNASGNS